MNAREAVFEWLAARGVSHLFGNPGSTEIPMLVGLPPAVRYVLGLHESVVVAMADGYAQATGRPALVSLHAAPGLGNAIGALFTARKNRAPLVVVAGQQDTRHLLLEPLLAADLVAMARPVVKWAVEVANPADVPAALEQGWHQAASPPPGPVFVSVPANFWDAPAVPATPRRLEPPGAPRGVAELADALARASRPALVFGPGVGRAGPQAVEAAVTVAERLGSDVYADPIGSRAGFPTDHPLFRGMLLPAAPRLAQALAGYDVVAVFGAPLFLTYPYLPGPLLPPGVRAFLVTDDPAEAARSPAAVSLIGDVGSVLAELAHRLPARVYSPPSRAGEQARLRADAARARPRLGAAYVLYTLGRLLPPEAVVVDEAISASPLLRQYVPVRRSGGYFTAGSGGLGWALPAAVGLKLAWPDRPVVAVVGDGSFHYAPQALWTAAREGLAVSVVVLDNGGYAILKSYAAAFYPGLAARVPGLDVPGAGIAEMARALGASAEQVDAPEALEGALTRVLEARGGPAVAVVAVDREVPRLF